jgi:hypothetical protein
LAGKKKPFLFPGCLSLIFQGFLELFSASASLFLETFVVFRV